MIPTTQQLKDYYFTDDQIDHLLKLARDKAFQIKYGQQSDEKYDFNELADQIEDQIVNHLDN